MGNNIELKSIAELLGMKFFIPNYQRGYRWTKQQVEDLLNDIDDFIQKNDKIEKDSFYCIQPLVVKEQIVNKDNFLDSLPKSSNDSLLEETRKAIAENTKWEVIDGQQRLTTIYILLSYLEQPDKYSLEYATRSSSKDFLGKITICKCEGTEKVGDEVKKHCENCENKSNECKCKGNDKVEIDYHHMIVAQATIRKWFSNKDKDTFKDTLLNKVKFIWYESVDENPISVFTRLNIGKISLTNSELIKALILNRSNFKEDNYSHVRLKQQEIASEWDRIEYTLQNDEFWLFIHNIDYNKPTRIDFIFDLIADNNLLELNDGYKNKIGTDQYRTFRYFYEYFNTGTEQNDKSKIDNCWEKVKNIFQIFEEWYNDLELYHYVGYLIYQGRNLNDLHQQWNEKNLKVEFIKELKRQIKVEIGNCKDLAQQYEINGGPSKTSCKRLLLLHNIQTVINQNNQLKLKEEYRQAVFYKFPFHLFKKENWDVEHIDSNTTNGLEKEKDQKEWLKYSVLGVTLDEDLKNRIKDFIQNPECESFEDLCQQIEKSDSKSWSNPEMDKNKIWNFVLLDAGTNRGYGNSIFPAKRRCIIGKDQGKKYSIDDSTLEVASVDGAIAFIPPVTKNVFLKYYNTSIDNLREWNESDAKAYKANILETLKEFGVTDLATQKGDENNE